jgi:hypothetical protein
MRKLLVPVLTALTAAAVTLAGCATPGTPGPAGGPTQSTSGTGQIGSGSPSPPSGPGAGQTASDGLTSLTITRTGGLAGVRQTLSLKPDGSWIYADTRNGATGRGTLTSSQRAAVVQVVTDPQLIAQLSQRTPPAVCNDGFVYALQLGSETFSFNDCSSAKLPADLVAALAAATPF